MRSLLFLALLAVASKLTLAQYGEDESLSTNPNEDLIRVKMLPGGVSATSSNDEAQMTVYNSRELPELSSGVVGTTVYNESLFYTGLYRSANQGGTFTTRVRIPNYAMFRINRTGDDASTTVMSRTFYFNYTKGLWEETIDTPLYYIRSIMGVHAYYSRTFFHAVRVIRKQTTSFAVSKTFLLSTHHVRQLEDQKFIEDLNIANTQREPIPSSEGVDAFQRTISINGATDSSDSEIVLYSNSPITSSSVTSLQFRFDRDRTESDLLILQTVAPSKDKRSALDEFKEFQTKASDFNSVFNTHVLAWEKRFKAGSIEVEGTGTNYAKMRRMIKSTLYQLYSQFPFPERFGLTTTSTGGTAATTEDLMFNGISACGLGRGGNSTKNARVDFAGHVTPDQELFVFPAIAMLHPDRALQILYYRTRQLQGSPPVPFEAARSGVAIDPLFCSQCAQQAYYPTGLLALAARQFHAITRNQQWVDLAQRGGLEIFDKVARFFDGKIQKNTTRAGDYYSIQQVIGPDEQHMSQTNNLLTNALASLSIHYWTYLRCLSNKPRDAALDATLDHARRLAFAFNPQKQTNEQFEGYDANTMKSISQADMMLTYFPVNFNMSGRWLEGSQARRLTNDIQKYGSDFMSTGPSMSAIPATTIAMKAIHQMQIGTNTEISNGLNSFEILKSYASTPFHVWRNLTERYDASAAGHLGTAAAFINTLIYGFGGLRLRTTRLDIQRPSMPHPEITAIRFKGMHFFGGEFDYSVMPDKVQFASVGGSAFKTGMLWYDRTTNRYQAFSGSGDFPIPAQQSYPSIDATSSAALFSIVSETNFNCPLEDQNYNSHNPYYWAAASGNHASLLVLVLSAIVAIFLTNRRDL